MRNSNHSLYDTSREKSVSFDASALRTGRTPDRSSSHGGALAGHGSHGGRSQTGSTYSPSRYTITSPKFISPLLAHTSSSPSSTRISHLDHHTAFSSSSVGAGIGSASKFQTLQSEFDMASRSVTHVIAAFRELQAKSRVLENERFAAIRERDELKARMTDLQRDVSLHRSQSEIKATENLLLARREGEKVKLEMGQVEEQLIAEEDVERSIKRGIIARETIISTLENDLRQLDGKLHALRRGKTLLTQDLEAAEARCERLTANIDEASFKHRERCAALHSEIDSVQRDVDQADKSLMRSSMRLSAMEKYMELVLNINGDLCDTLSAREEAKSRILKLAGKYAPPRYSWPKSRPYPTMANVVDVISDAATASALQDRASNATTNKSKPKNKSKSHNYSANMYHMSAESGSLASNSTLERPHSSRDTSSRVGDANLNAQLRGLRPMSAPEVKRIKKPPLKIKRKSSQQSQSQQLHHSSSSTRENLSPGRLLERRAAEIVAAVAMSTGGSPVRHLSPARDTGAPVDAFIPSSGNVKTEFNSIAKDRIESRETLQRFAAFASKVKGQQLSDLF